MRMGSCCVTQAPTTLLPTPVPTSRPTRVPTMAPSLPVCMKRFVHNASLSTAAFSTAIEGKRVEINDGRVKIDGTSWDVWWLDAVHADGWATIRTVEPKTGGEITLSDGAQFENPASVSAQTIQKIHTSAHFCFQDILQKMVTLQHVGTCPQLRPLFGAGAGTRARAHTHTG